MALSAIKPNFQSRRERDLCHSAAASSIKVITEPQLCGRWPTVKLGGEWSRKFSSLRLFTRHSPDDLSWSWKDQLNDCLDRFGRLNREETVHATNVPSLPSDKEQKILASQVIELTKASSNDNGSRLESPQDEQNAKRAEENFPSLSSFTLSFRSVDKSTKSSFMALHKIFVLAKNS